MVLRVGEDNALAANADAAGAPTAAGGKAPAKRWAPRARGPRRAPRLAWGEGALHWAAMCPCVTDLSAVFLWPWHTPQPSSCGTLPPANHVPPPPPGFAPAPRPGTKTAERERIKGLGRPEQHW